MEPEGYTKIFNRAINDYHMHDDVNAIPNNPYPENSIEFLLYQKNWIDTVQWHLEDLIRDPRIDPEKGMEIKRRIDRSNQERTDMVEQIDDYFFAEFGNKTTNEQAPLNTESPAWAIDRLSILALKIYHMKEQVMRDDISDEHRRSCEQKLSVLLEQQDDLVLSIRQLLDHYNSGKKQMKVYRQMKMYNDPSLNPVLYKNK